MQGAHLSRLKLVTRVSYISISFCYLCWQDFIKPLNVDIHCTDVYECVIACLCVYAERQACG